MTIQTELQKSALGAFVALYQLNLTAHGEGILYFTPHTGPGGASNVSFGSQVYLPLPMEFTGYSQSVTGEASRPSIKISNASKFLQSYLTDYDDIRGAPITRIITMEKFLDSGSSPDGSQILATQKFIVQQKVKLNKVEIEFVLTSILDAPNIKLPRGIVLRTEFPGAGLYRKT
jgi:lambda family phage minor tail protein L